MAGRAAEYVGRGDGCPSGRMTFWRALRSEAARMRRSPLLALHAVLAVALGGLAGAYFATSAWDSLMGADAFFQLLGAAAPLLAGISCGLAADVEARAGDSANLLGAPSRRRALAAKAAALLGLGLAAAAVAAALFCGTLALAGRPLPAAGALCAAVAGMAAGSAGLYVAFLLAALRFGRNASIGVGALGLIAALASLGGLANGLVTGALSGTLGAGLAAFVPFAWPSRLATLPLELCIAAAAAPEAAAGIAQSYLLTGAVCAGVSVAAVAAALAFANRFEPRRCGD